MGTGLGNYSYIWAKLKDQNTKGSYFLVDTGADISILPDNMFQDIYAEDCCNQIVKADRSIYTGNRSKCKVRGMTQAELNIEGKAYVHRFYICSDATCPIIGNDFMAKHNLYYQPSRRKMMLEDKEIPCFNPKTIAKMSKVCMYRSYTIPPETEVVVQATVSGKAEQNGKICEINRSNTLFPRTGAMLCRTTAIPNNDRVPVRIANFTTEPIRMWKGTIVGVSEPVMSVTELAEQDKDATTCECKCGCVPGENQDGAESKCCHELERRDRGQEQYDYVTVNQHVAVEFFRQFEADINIPEHVRQLYYATLPMLKTVEQRDRLAQTLSDYADCFAKTADDIGRTSLVKHTIDTADAKPVHQRCRRFARAHIAVIKEQIQKLSKAGIIRPSQSNWAANPVVVDKKPDANGVVEKRMCIDYRGLNAVTVNPDSYMLPRIDDTLDALSQAKYFCTLDLTQGYHQVELEESDKHKTAFHAPYCNPTQWEYNYMPFGLIRAPRTFQRMMDRVIQGLEYETALAYLDDVIVYGKTIDQTMDRMTIILERLRKANLKLKAKKCILFSQKVKYLGHVISDRGVMTDPEKVEAVEKWHRPRTIKHVRSFLGTINYYSRFIQNLAEKAMPLQEITKKNAKFKWGAEQEKAFQSLKKSLTEAPIMAYPKQEGMFILDTDASDYCYGAVLSQLQKSEDGEEIERVIAYASKKFSDREKKYCARRRELLAIVNFVKHFDVYLRGVTFKIRTDHASLRYIKTVKELPNQFFRWIMRMEEYSYKIEIRKGILHANADGMSRGCHGDKCICDDLVRFEQKHCIRKGTVLEAESEEQDAFVCNMYISEPMAKKCKKEVCFVRAFKLGPEYSAEELAELQKHDADIWPVLRAKLIDPDKRPSFNEICAWSKPAKAYSADWDRLKLYNGALYRIWQSADGTRKVNQFILPRSLQKKFCEKVHDTSRAAHMGKRKTMHAMLHFCYWYRMSNDIAYWIRTCDKCQRRKHPNPKRKAPLVPIVTGEPNERLQMDITGPWPTTITGYKYVLVITDMFSKYTEAFAMKDMKAETVADHLLKGWIKKKGPPAEIHTDQGTNFESSLIADICKTYQIHKTRTSGYHPESDGQVERFNRSLKQMIYGIAERTDTWEEYLDDCTAAYNGTVHESTGFTPNFLWCGRERRFNMGMLLPNPDEGKQTNYFEYTSNMMDRLRTAYKIARDTLNKKAQQSIAYHDTRSNFREYHVGEKIMLRDFTATGVFEGKYTGPYFVLDRIGLVNYKIQESENKPPRITHYNRMKEYDVKEPYVIPGWVVAGSEELTEQERKMSEEGKELVEGIIKPRGKVPPLFRSIIHPNAIKVADRYPRRPKIRRKRRRKEDKEAEHQDQNQKDKPMETEIQDQAEPPREAELQKSPEKPMETENQNTEATETQIKPKPKRGRPRKRERIEAEMEIQDPEPEIYEPEAVVVRRSRYGRAVKRPKRDF